MDARYLLASAFLDGLPSSWWHVGGAARLLFGKCLGFLGRMMQLAWFCHVTNEDQKCLHLLSQVRDVDGQMLLSHNRPERWVKDECREFFYTSLEAVRFVWGIGTTPPRRL